MKDHNSGTFCMDIIIIFTNHYKVGVAMPRKTFVQITNENCYTVPLANAYMLRSSLERQHTGQWLHNTTMPRSDQRVSMDTHYKVNQC